MKLRARNTLVRIKRRGRLDRVDGYVIAVGAELALVAVHGDTMNLDGFTAIRRRDVKSVERRYTGEFARAVLKLREQWPPGRPPVYLNLNGVVELLASLRSAPLVGIHIEYVDSGVMYIGRVIKVGRRNLHLREVTPVAHWAGRRTKIRLDAVSRVDVGDLYSYALLQVGGEPDRPLRRGVRRSLPFVQ